MFDILYQVSTLKALLVGIATALFVYWARKRFKYKLPPGPFALPLIGNILQFKNSRIHEQFMEWSQKYGPVISVNIGPIYTVVLNDIETVMEAMVKKGGDFANRMSFASVDVRTYGGKDIAFSQYGPTLKLHRRIALKALRYYMMGEALEERVHDAVFTAIEELKKETGPFDPEDYVNFIVGNILTGLCFGGKYTYNDTELRNVLRVNAEFTGLFNGGGILEDLVPAVKYVWETKKFRRVKEITKELLEDYIGAKFEEHKKSFDKDNIRDFTDMLILARQEAEEDPSESNLEKLEDINLINTIADIFFAGIDTSRLTLRWAILHMAAYPEIQTKVQEEIDRVIGFDDMPRSIHRSDLGYTESALHESMRLATVSPTGIPHVTTCDTSVGGYTIPKNTNVVINHWALHHDPKKWDNVTEFRSERYLENGKLGPKPESWLPFSAGRRVCLGEMVAKPELLFIFASLMQRFRWNMPEGQKIDLSPAGNMFQLEPNAHKFVVVDRKPQ